MKVRLALYGCPVFESDPTGQLLDRASSSIFKAHALVEGQQVQIWSESQQSWEHGEVVQKVNQRSKIMVCKRYGDQLREKWLDAALVAKLVQVFASSSASSAWESAWE